MPRFDNGPELVGESFSGDTPENHDGVTVQAKFFTPVFHYFAVFLF
jgi:hypothetical protein